MDKYNFLGKKINKENFNIDFSWSFDAFEVGYPTDWVLKDEYLYSKDIFNLVPFSLDPQYITDYKQFFEPSNFYRNVVSICAIAERQKSSDKGEYLKFLKSYIDHGLHFSKLRGKSRFVYYNFDLKRQGYVLKKPWVSAIGNGFMLRALTRIYLFNKDSMILELMRQYARPFMCIQDKHHLIQGKWFTWLDDEGFLWFDEYPGDDGYPSLVLNGHIHAMHGIYTFLKVLPDSDERKNYLDLYQAAMTTIKYNGDKFRRLNNINRYSIREYNKDDYLPDRTIRQQKELYKLTKDIAFLNYAEKFEKDLLMFRKKVGH